RSILADEDATVERRVGRAEGVQFVERRGAADAHLGPPARPGAGDEVLDAVAGDVAGRHPHPASEGRMRDRDREAERAAYRKAAVWGFREAPPDGGRDYGNANVWSFDPNLEVLVREVLQNARDAGLGGNQQVDVTFRIIRLERTSGIRSGCSRGQPA